jgi:hypothetical protein
VPFLEIGFILRIEKSAKPEWVGLGVGAAGGKANIVRRQFSLALAMPRESEG